ncbi:hypothetical protein [Deinococcus radiophilus]|uniref:hypothetical protein n=1 Tax=Deinococcus radiophilus TaxID=32062 RepID=UPI000F82DD2C|nr:hypothetical protein [Deinococcus radiophilus]UFA50540.1 hypothetical protein LMT64_01070 [Deinococcus radiophilus]
MPKVTLGQFGVKLGVEVSPCEFEEGFGDPVSWRMALSEDITASPVPSIQCPSSEVVRQQTNQPEYQALVGG